MKAFPIVLLFNSFIIRNSIAIVLSFQLNVFRNNVSRQEALNQVLISAV